jgi:hypothetical protein
MDIQRRRTPSYLYTIRLWQEAVGDGQTEWRGQVKYLASGEERFFRDWSGLCALMVGMVEEAREGRRNGN